MGEPWLDDVRRAGEKRRAALAERDEAYRVLRRCLIAAHESGATYYRLAQVCGITQAAVRKIILRSDP